MLVNIAVGEGVSERMRFVKYIDFLEEGHYFSSKAKGFVEYIRNIGNEANHVVRARMEEDPLALIEYVGALLRHNYELPSKVLATETSAS